MRTMVELKLKLAHLLAYGPVFLGEHINSLDIHDEGLFLTAENIFKEAQKALLRQNYTRMANAYNDLEAFLGPAVLKKMEKFKRVDLPPV